MQQSGFGFYGTRLICLSIQDLFHGAATSCHADVFAYAACTSEKGHRNSKELGAENYVFWGGREGYDTLLNTDMKRELDHLATFLHLAVDYAKENGFTVNF